MTREELDSRFHGIAEHYRHACEKHPFFADTICNRNDDWGKEAGYLKWLLQNRIKDKKQLTGHSVLMAELYEVFDAFCSGDYAQARYEVLDAIAVLLRMDDMIKERQEETK